MSSLTAVACGSLVLSLRNVAKLRLWNKSGVCYCLPFFLNMYDIWEFPVITSMQMELSDWHTLRLAKHWPVFIMKLVQAKLHASTPATMSLFLLKCDSDAIQWCLMFCSTKKQIANSLNSHKEWNMWKIYCWYCRWYYRYTLILIAKGLACQKRTSVHSNLLDFLFCWKNFEWKVK